MKAMGLLGKQVRVTIDHPDLGKRTIKEGRLLGFGDDGEFIIDDDMGFVWYGWPMLDIEEAA